MIRFDMIPNVVRVRLGNIPNINMHVFLNTKTFDFFEIKNFSWKKCTSGNTLFYISNDVNL